MADTKISQLPKSSSLAGDELFVFAKGNSNGSVSAETVKEFATKEVNEGLGGKLDKSEWDKKTEQFTQYGIIRETGIVQWTDSWQNTPFILINREYDIEYHVRMDSTRNIIIQLYDESMSVVMTEWNDGSITDVKGRIAKEDIPTNAVYFRINNLTGSAGSYSNGPTFESREGAVSEAISKVATMKLNKSEWEPKNRQFNITNFRLGANGSANPSDVVSRITPFIPINHDYDIRIVARLINNLPGIQFFDEHGTFISDAFSGFHDSALVERVVPKADIPKDAVYFRAGAYASTTATEPSWENGGTFESREGATSSAIAAAKKALFIDMWNKACAHGGTSYGRYNAETGFFELNGLTDISYEDALLIYKRSPNAYAPYICQDLRVRTVLPLTRVQGQVISDRSAFEGCIRLEVVDALGNVAMGSPNAFYNCQNLREIRHPVQFDEPLPASFFYNCLRLELVKIIIKKPGTYHLECSAHLSLASFRYLVDNSIVATTAITVIVHPDVYAKLTDEANTEWYQILLDAAEKNIQFATA